MSGSGNLKIRDIRSKDILNTISVEGEVSIIKEIHPIWKTTAYMCDHCEFIMYLPVEGSKVGKPVHCENEWCGNKSDFTLLEKKSTYTDSQDILIKESDHTEPRTLLVHLEGDLVDSINFKDRVVVTGVLKAQFKSTTTGNFVLEASSIEKIKEKNMVSDNKTETDSKEQIRVMREIIDQLSSSSPSNDVSLEDIYREASNLHVERYIAEELITKLKHKGDLMSLGPEHVRAVW